jgi:transcriptional regulator with XRE-family HTH domain
MDKKPSYTRYPTTADQAIGQCIRNAREARGLTAEEVVEHLDIGEGTYNAYELGHISVPISRLITLAEVLGLDPVRLVGVAMLTNNAPLEGAGCTAAMGLVQKADGEKRLN